MNVDLINSLSTGTLRTVAAAATNNSATAGLDTQGFIGQIAVNVNQGVPTAGDAGQQFKVLLQASDTNNASNATNCVGTAGSLIFTGTTNNTATFAQLTFDKRAEHRYLFARIVITGGNSPSAPIGITYEGQLQEQPN